MRAANALTRLHVCACSSERSLLADVISSTLSCAGPYTFRVQNNTLTFCTIQYYKPLLIHIIQPNLRQVQESEIMIEYSRNMSYCTEYRYDKSRSRLRFTFQAWSFYKSASEQGQND